MVIKGFNTGRQYTSQGQRIAYATLDDNSRVIFADFDRMIYGEFDWFLSEEPRASEVMAAYDANGYRMSCEAMQLRSKWVEGGFPLVRF